MKIWILFRDWKYGYFKMEGQKEMPLSIKEVSNILGESEIALQKAASNMTLSRKIVTELGKDLWLPWVWNWTGKESVPKEFLDFLMTKQLKFNYDDKITEVSEIPLVTLDEIRKEATIIFIK